MKENSKRLVIRSLFRVLSIIFASTGIASFPASILWSISAGFDHPTRRSGLILICGICIGSVLIGLSRLFYKLSEHEKFKRLFEDTH